METQTQGWRGGGAAAISEGYWLTAGSSPRCQDGGAPRIWMKQQQNGFASPSLSLLPPSPEDDRVRMAEGKKKTASACCERHCIIYTEEHKQSWTNCLKRKMWSLCIHRSIRLHTRAHSRTARSLPAAWKTSLLLVPVNVSASLILHSHLKTLSSFQTGRVRWWEDHQ